MMGGQRPFSNQLREGTMFRQVGTERFNAKDEFLSALDTVISHCLPRKGDEEGHRLAPKDEIFFEFAAYGHDFHEGCMFRWSSNQGNGSLATCVAQRASDCCPVSRTRGLRDKLFSFNFLDPEVDEGKCNETHDDFRCKGQCKHSMSRLFYEDVKRAFVVEEGLMTLQALIDKAIAGIDACIKRNDRSILAADHQFNTMLH